jgi:uncharacterized protein with ATP-grasp and redox domains
MKKPDLLRTSEIGSFAESTIKQRKPEILRRIIRDNQFSSDILNNLNRFLTEIQGDAPPNPLAEVTLDTVFWNEKLASLHPKSWFDLPWYFAEAYFYRRVLEATGYYQTKSDGFMRDPFHPQKANQLRDDLQSLENSLWLFDPENPERSFERLMLAALWGNRADLSHMDIDLSSPALDLAGGEHLEMLINNIPETINYFSRKSRSVAYMTDNVGRELYSDLALIEYLLNEGFADYVTMLVKPAPLFVSDAMRKDVDLALQLLLESKLDVLQSFAKRIQLHIKNGLLVILEEPSLCGYQMFDEMPFDFYRNLSSFDLAVVKGDANYRRVVGDRHWDFLQPVNEIVQYFPADLLMLRTLKSEVVVNLTQEQVEKLNHRYKDWLVKGYCGLIQFIIKN